jgi:TIR domain-containing protein
VLFLSYAEEDAEIAGRIATWFDGQGVRIFNWLSPQDRGGQFIWQIEQAISTANGFLALLSPSFLSSPWCRRERYLAMQREEDFEDRSFIHVLEVAPTPKADTGFMRSYDWRNLIGQTDIEPVLRSVLEKIPPDPADATATRTVGSRLVRESYASPTTSPAQGQYALMFGARLGVGKNVGEDAGEEPPAACSDAEPSWHKSWFGGADRLSGIASAARLEVQADPTVGQLDMAGTDEHSTASSSPTEPFTAFAQETAISQYSRYIDKDLDSDLRSGRDIAGHVFISYVREDAHHVDRLQSLLEGTGIPVWRDTEKLWPGEDWRFKISHAITLNAIVFLACFSAASLARQTTYQNEELTLAIEQLRLRRIEIPWLIPVRFDECEIPERDLGGGRLLSSIQRADFFEDNSAVAGKRLVESILRILEPS